MKIIKPPTPLPDYLDSPSIFLAGSIEQGKAIDWQKKFQDAFLSDDVTILNPRRDEWDASWVQSITNPQFKGQVEWELEGLDKCDFIAMYFDPSTMSPITLLELGLFAESEKIFLCCPDGYWRKGNVDIVAEQYDIPLYDNLEDLIEGIKEEITEYI